MTTCRDAWLPLLLPFRIAPEVDEADAARFVACFRQTWHRLPASVRQVFLEHRPAVVLRWEFPHLGRDGQDLFGEFLHTDHTLTIAWRFAGELPEALLQVLIAHEAAHGLMWYRREPLWRDEARAFALASAWGFDMERLLRHTGHVLPDDTPEPLGDTRP